VVGQAVALSFLLGRSEKAAVWVQSIVVYPDGFQFSVDLHHRLDEEELGFRHVLFQGPRRRRGEGIDPNFVRLGIEFSDGGRATNLEVRVPSEPGQGPQNPVLMGSGSSTGGGYGRDGGHWQWGQWVWPLPPEGPLAFVCEWPVADIPETRNEIDSSPIRDAAPAAVILWPDDADLES
jgi:hypothetical protein